MEESLREERWDSVDSGMQQIILGSTAAGSQAVNWCLQGCRFDGGPVQALC